MKKFREYTRIVALALILSLTVTPMECVNASPEELEEAALESAEVSEEEAVADNEIIVVYDDAGTSETKSEEIKEEAKETLNNLNVEITDEIAEANEQQGTVAVAEIPDDLKIEDAIEQITEDENVSYAQPNFIYRILEDEKIDTNAVVNDPYAGYYKYSSEKNYLEDAHVLEAWDTIKSQKTTTVAVFDSGCRLTHEDLRNNIIKNYAYDAYYDRALTTSSAPNGGDSTGHGTHVCGLVAAQADNGKGTAGTSYNANILPVKIFDNYGSGATTVSLMRGMEYCRQLIESGKVSNLHVMNMSIGYYPADYRGGMSSEDYLLGDTIKMMADYYDVLCVCSGGNGDRVGNPRTDEIYPSDFEECLSVTALDTDDGNCEWSDYNQAKDISAPGEGIGSTYYTSDSSYAYSSGTSMAAPIVSGICALLWAKDPSLSVDEVVEAIETTADPVAGSDEDGRSENSGSHGAVNAAKALAYITSGGSTSTGATSISSGNITGIDVSYEYTGGKIKPVPTVQVSGKTLKKNSDYTVSYKNNVNVGTATMVVKGIGNYAGSVTKTFKITVKDIAKCAISLAGTSYAYTGKAITPAVTVQVSSKNAVKLKKGVDYTITYSNNIEPGTASVIIKAAGNNYTGSITKTYTITKANVSKLSVSLSASSYTYNKKAKKPAVTIKNGSLTLENGKDYTVSYSNNVKVGTAKVKITGKGNHYTGTVTKTFKINPKGTKISKLTKSSKGFTAKWKKQTTQTTGYQIQYSTSSQFKSAKTKTITKTKTTTQKISKLKKKKVYYVRVRTYKKVSGKKYYAAWSTVKKVKTK